MTTHTAPACRTILPTWLYERDGATIAMLTLSAMIGGLAAMLTLVFATMPTPHTFGTVLMGTVAAAFLGLTGWVGWETGR